MVDLRDGTWVAYPNGEVIKNGDTEIIGWYIRSASENATFDVVEFIDYKEKTINYSWNISTEDLDNMHKTAVDNGEVALAELYDKEIEYRSSTHKEGLDAVIELILEGRKRHSAFGELKDYKILN